MGKHEGPSEQEIEQDIYAQMSMMNQGAVPTRADQLPSQPHPDDDIIAKVEFVYDKEDNMRINISYNDTTKETSSELARMLHYINTGNFEEHCSEILVNIAKENPTHSHFIRHLFKKWNGFRDEEQIIRPSQVFAMSNRPGPPE